MALSGQVARLWEAPRFRVEGPEKVLSLPLPGLRPPRALLPAGLRDGCLTWQSQCGYEGLNWTTPPPAQNSPTDAQCSENKTQALLSDLVSDRLAPSSPLPTLGHADSLCACTLDTAALPTAMRVRVHVCVCVCVTCSCTKRRPASVALPHHPLWTTARAPPSLRPTAFTVLIAAGEVLPSLLPRPVDCPSMGVGSSSCSLLSPQCLHGALLKLGAYRMTNKRTTDEPRSPGVEPRRPALRLAFPLRDRDHR